MIPSPALSKRRFSTELHQAFTKGFDAVVSR